MKKNKFIIDLGSVELDEKQVEQIQKGLEKVVSGILAENTSTREVKLSPVTPEMALKLYGLNGNTSGYKPLI